MEFRNYKGCENSATRCDLIDHAPSTRCTACNGYVVYLDRPANWTPRVQPKTPEQLRETYFSNLKLFLAAGGNFRQTPDKVLMDLLLADLSPVMAIA